MIVALFAVASVSMAQPRNVAIYDSGNTLYSDCTSEMESAASPAAWAAVQSECVGYISAIADVMSIEPVNGFRACIPPPVTLEQLREIVVTFLNSHVAVRQDAAPGLVASALAESFPCPR